ncbi:MAG TPA: type IV toxin-antitoxin system AbiEi family antitoxin domain-containing protein [Actinomycetes bacterium]|nr:type IV toxin-antitoxin system AbiEi family antitoxin domain-containing protein [Actinomycetes bacterium]
MLTAVPEATSHRRTWQAEATLAEIAATQGGVISRRQAFGAGLGRDSIRRRLRAGRWSRVHAGVYAVAPSRPTLHRVWAGLLYAGADAVASHHTAAWLDGFAHEPAEIEVTIPERRRVRPVAGIRVYRSIAIESRRHPSRIPPRTRVEDTVLDLAERADHVGDMVAVVSWACRERLTTAERIAVVAAGRKKFRNRPELAAVLEDVASGTLAVLEHLYLTLVERAHGLPAGLRQVGIGRGLRTEYRDVYYRGFGLVVELDGAVGHSADADRSRDMRRDNADVLAGQLVLRFMFADVARRPCVVAAQVLLALGQRGWDGRPRRCGPACQLDVD